MGQGLPLLMLPLLLAAQAVQAGADESQQVVVALSCQLNNGPWQPCRMVRAADGYHWRLELAQHPVLFRHDGSGVVFMRGDGGPWHSVEARWRDDASLCWNSLCAKGAIPLD